MIASYLPPSREHLLGTNDVGQDIFSEMVYGTRVSLYIGIFAAFIVTGVGTVLALVSGYFGGVTDKIITAITNIAMPENGLHFSEGFAMAHEDYAEGGCKYAPRCRFCKGKCKETPPMAEVDGHKVRCWLYAGKEENKHASENRKPV